MDYSKLLEPFIIQYTLWSPSIQTNQIQMMPQIACFWSYPFQTSTENKDTQRSWIRRKKTWYLFDKDGKALVFKWLGELYVLGSFIVYSERSNNHVCQTSQELTHHSIPLFLVAVVHLRTKGGFKVTHQQQHLASPRTLGKIVVEPNRPNIHWCFFFQKPLKQIFPCHFLLCPD